MIVRDAMIDYFASAHISSTVGDAMEKMLEEGLSTLFVVDDKSRLVGAIEEIILMEAVFDQQWRHNSVAMHMKRDFTTVSPDDNVNTVVQKFREGETSEFPVMVGGKLIGVVTRRQLLRAILNRSRAEKRAILV